MNNIIDIDSARPTREAAIRCQRCGHKYVAVFPDSTTALECPGCHEWINEFGAAVSKHTCKTCKRPFTLCPPDEGKGYWDNCLADDCASYDKDRDPTR